MAESITDYISIRQLKPEDIHFILDSSISCLSKYTESIVKGQNRSDIHQHLEIIMLCALNRIDYSIFIASHKDDEDNIISYIIANPETNHVFFQYTKYNYRKLGIQKYMLLPLVVDDEQPISVNFPTKEMLKLVKANKITVRDYFTEDLIDEAIQKLRS